MSAASINVRYRPVRIGFCVKDGDMDALRAAMRNCHALWGGRYNPIIVMGDEAAARQREPSRRHATTRVTSATSAAHGQLVPMSDLRCRLIRRRGADRIGHRGVPATSRGRPKGGGPAGGAT